MSLKQFDVKLQNGSRVFSTLSNLPEDQVFSSSGWTRVIFLIHGFPDNNSSYNDVWPLLLESFKKEKVLLLAPLMRGYEPSSQGSLLEYKPSDFAGDFKSFIISIKPNGRPVHLLGHDWGAITAFKTAQLYPDLITSISTLAIPYLANLRIWEYAWFAPEQAYLSSYFYTMGKNKYGDGFKQTDENSYLDKLWKYWSPNWKYSRETINDVRSTLVNNNVITHAAAYYTCLINLWNFGELSWKVDFDKVPTLIVGGETDGCMSVRLLRREKVKLAGQKVSVFEVPEAGHFLQREAPEIVAKLSAEWFLKHS